MRMSGGIAENIHFGLDFFWLAYRSRKGQADRNAALEAKLYPPTAPSGVIRPLPDWPLVHRELGRKGVTLDLLWQEYKERHPDGYPYSGFCEHHPRWVGKLSVTMRQTPTPGDKLFVDHTGNTVSVTDRGIDARKWIAIFTRCDSIFARSVPDRIGTENRTLRPTTRGRHLLRKYSIA